MTDPNSDRNLRNTLFEWGSNNGFVFTEGNSDDLYREIIEPLIRGATREARRETIADARKYIDATTPELENGPIAHWLQLKHHFDAMEYEIDAELNQFKEGGGDGR